MVNTARGRLIDSLDTLEEGLVSGRIGGVGLDVLPEEPPGAHRLINAWRRREEWTLGRVIITPHNAFFSDYSMNECRFAGRRDGTIIPRGKHSPKPNPFKIISGVSGQSWFADIPNHALIASASTQSVAKLRGCSNIPPPKRPTSPELSRIPRLTNGCRLDASHSRAVRPTRSPNSAKAG